MPVLASYRIGFLIILGGIELNPILEAKFGDDPLVNILDV